MLLANKGNDPAVLGPSTPLTLNSAACEVASLDGADLTEYVYTFKTRSFKAVVSEVGKMFNAAKRSVFTAPTGRTYVYSDGRADLSMFEGIVRVENVHHTMLVAEAMPGSVCCIVRVLHHRSRSIAPALWPGKSLDLTELAIRRVRGDLKHRFDLEPNKDYYYGVR